MPRTLSNKHPRPAVSYRDAAGRYRTGTLSEATAPSAGSQTVNLLTPTPAAPTGVTRDQRAAAPATGTWKV